jgi:hypothetical protein
MFILIRKKQLFQSTKTPLCKSAQLYTTSEQAAYLSFPCFKLCLPENSITPLFFLFPKKFFELFGDPVEVPLRFFAKTLGTQFR